MHIIIYNIDNGTRHTAKLKSQDGTAWQRGSVNILGFHSVEDNLIRFKNPEIATSLLETLHKGS